MNPTDVAPISPDDWQVIKTLLQSGGNVAAMGAIYVGFKILALVKEFLLGIAKTLQDNVNTNNEVIRTMASLRVDIQSLHILLSQGPRLVRNVRKGDTQETGNE